MRSPNHFVSVVLFVVGAAGVFASPAAAQFELFPTRPAAKTFVRRTVLSVQFLSATAPSGVGSVESAIYDDGSAASSVGSSRSRCISLPSDVRCNLQSLLETEALQQALSAGRVKGCLNRDSLQTPALLINDGRATYVFSALAFPDPIRAFVAKVDEAFAAAACHPHFTPIGPLLRP